MEKTLTKAQVEAILNNAPTGVNKTKLLDSFVLKGYDLEGIDSNARRIQLQNQQPVAGDVFSKIAGTQATQEQPAQSGSSVYNIPKNIYEHYKQAIPNFMAGTENARKDISEGMSQIENSKPFSKERFSGMLKEGTGMATAGLQAASVGLDAVFAPITETLKGVIPQTGNRWADAATQGAAAGITFAGPAGAIPGAVISEAFTGLQALEDFAKKSPELASVLQEHPDVLQNINNALSIGLILYGDYKSKQLAPGGKPDLLNTPVSQVPGRVGQNWLDTGIAVTKPINKGFDKLTESTLSVADKAQQEGQILRDKVQEYMGKKNLSPQTETSAKRLVGEQNKGLVDQYDKWVQDAKRNKIDPKVDAPIEEVGSRTGDAFNKVIEQRRAIGRILGDELKANGSVKVSVVDAKTNLLGELKGSGLSYNPKTGKLTSFQGSKFAPDEVKMLNTFVQDLIRLGDRPTASQIDNFVSQTRSTLQFTKGKSGVMGTTNAERIINGGVSNLRASLDPSISGNEALARYWEANKTYADLSAFIEEGGSFLGKKTLTGDYAKDASVAKSAVQSILNQGKKDFLIKLEELTGYPALDEAVLASQAMSDAGNFKGSSLLQLIGDSSQMPTSKSGAVQQILDWGLKAGTRAIAGTPEEQTRAFLQSLENSLKVPPIKNTTSKTKPQTGAK